MPQSEDSLAGELTIRVGVQRSMYEITALTMEFMKLHPGVTVTIDADYSITQWSRSVQRGAAHEPGELPLPAADRDRQR